MQARSTERTTGGSPDKGWSIDFAGHIARAFLAVALVVPAAPAAMALAGAPASVIVRGTDGSAREARQVVSATGGRIVRRLPIIDGFEAAVPAAAIPALQRDPAIASISPNLTLRPEASAYDPSSDLGSMFNVTVMSGARAMWHRGFTGAGVDVAIIDSGMAPVDGLRGGKVINGPDLSFESQAPGRRYLDTYGHGTHLGGIIAGRSSGATPGRYVLDTTNFLGMAPDARIVSLKVADAHGATDVSQVIAAISWVVQHRNDRGMNIRVLNLSYGTNSTQSYLVDPLAFAAEVAWHKGIVVVTAAGNAGYAERGTLTNPASDPWLIAVGACDTKGTIDLRDDEVSSFSSSINWGNDGSDRTVDLVAPGKSIVSLRVPGSYIDQQFPNGRIGTRRFRGSGTSQAAAIVSGAVALLLQQRPNLKPDEVKRLIGRSATTIRGGAVRQGQGELNLVASMLVPNGQVSGYDQDAFLARSTGTGSLEASRGDYHLESARGIRLRGEVDIFGRAFNASAMASAQAAGNSWSGGVWNGNSWAGNSWSGNSWSGVEWTGNSWSGNSWSGVEWTGVEWTGNSWSGNSWSGNSWSGNSWSGNSWSSFDWGVNSGPNGNE